MDYYAHCIYQTPNEDKYFIINKVNDYTSERDILISTDAFDYFTKHHTIYEGKHLSYEEYDEDTYTTLYQVSFENTEEFKLIKSELLDIKDEAGWDIYRVTAIPL